MIELLVVISIIGLLSILAIISLGAARAKARDARRLSDVRQMANVFSLERSGGGSSATALVGCVADTEEKNTRKCTGPGGVANFINFADPSIVDPDDDTTICKADSTDVCQYALAIGSTDVENALILFFLEDDVGGYPPGLHVINPEGIVN